MGRLSIFESHQVTWVSLREEKGGEASACPLRKNVLCAMTGLFALHVIHALRTLPGAPSAQILYMNCLAQASTDLMKSRLKEIAMLPRRQITTTRCTWNRAPQAPGA